MFGPRSDPGAFLRPMMYRHEMSNRVPKTEWIRVGERLQKARLKRGLSQEDLASKVGVRGLTISRHETGRYMPSEKMMIAYAKALGVTDIELRYGLRADEVEAAPSHVGAVDRYLQSPWAAGCSRSIAKRLRLVSFENLGLDKPSREAIHDMRLYLERHAPPTRAGSHKD